MRFSIRNIMNIDISLFRVRDDIGLYYIQMLVITP